MLENNKYYLYTNFNYECIKRNWWIKFKAVANKEEKHYIPIPSRLSHPISKRYIYYIYCSACKIIYNVYYYKHLNIYNQFSICKGCYYYQ